MRGRLPSPQGHDEHQATVDSEVPRETDLGSSRKSDLLRPTCPRGACGPYPSRLGRSRAALGPSDRWFVGAVRDDVVSTSSSQQRFT